MTQKSTSGSEKQEDRKYRLRWRTLVVLSVSLIIIGLDATILNVALPTIQQDLGASASALQWIVDAYVLVFAGLLLTMGSLGDRFGRKRALQAGLIIFGAASVFAAYSQTSEQLIAARALMGVGGALIMPSTLSVIVDVFPLDERGRAIGIWTGMAALGIAGGPVLGGLLVEQFSWGSVFLINVPVLGVALAGGWFLVPESRDPTSPRLDIPGSLLSIGMLFSLVYGIIEAPGRGWFDPLVAGTLVSSAVLAAAFVVRELRTDHPLLDLSLFRNRRFSTGAASIMVAFFAILGTIFMVSQYMQFVLGYSAVEAGLEIAPLGVGMMIGALNSHRLVARFGTHRVVAFGLVVVASVLISVSFWTSGTPWWLIAISMAGLAFGVGNIMAPSTDAVMGAVPAAKAGVGSAMNDVTRQVGGALGIAVLGSVLNSLYTANMTVPAAVPEAQADLARDSLGAAIQIAASLGGAQGEALANAGRSAFMDAMGMAFLVAAAVSVLGAPLVLRFMPARHLGAGAGAGTEPAKGPSRSATAADS